jgi:hypothetical protein
VYFVREIGASTFFIYFRQTEEIQNQPSPSLLDLVSYLTNVTNAALMNLPEAIKSSLYFDALQHLSFSLKVRKC